MIAAQINLDNFLVYNSCLLTKYTTTYQQNVEYVEKLFGHFATHFFTNLTWASIIYIEEILAWQQSVFIKVRNEKTRCSKIDQYKLSLCLCFIFDFFQFQVRSNRRFDEMNKKWTLAYCNNTSRLEAHAGFFRLLMKGIFDPYVLWPFDKKLIF